MSDNKEHIEAIKRYGEEYAWARAAIRALKFEDAAKAKDSEVEQVHCERSCEVEIGEFSAYRKHATWLMVERALARAEVEAKYASTVRAAHSVIEADRAQALTDQLVNVLWRCLDELEGK